MGAVGGAVDGAGSTFALIAYLPDPLAGLVEQIRRELVPGCEARAHVTVLPPRPLACVPQDAWNEIRHSLRDFAPFPVALADVCVLPVSEAIYVSLRTSAAEFEALNRPPTSGRCGSRRTFNTIRM